jgi:DnaJ family protein A protein 5
MLVHTPMRGKTDYWTGRVDKTSGNITGENNMGKLLMEVRQELRKPKESSQKEGKRIGAIKDKGKGKFVDKNKDDDNIKDENKDDDDIKDDNQKGGDVIKGDDESTTSETKDSPSYKAEKRKHEGNDVQVKYPDEEVSEGPKIKRKKIEEKSKDVLEGKDENKDGDKNKDDDKKGGIEDKGDDAETSRETMDGSENKGEKRKRDGNDVQVECLDEEVPERPNISRKKTEEESKDDLENKSGDEKKSDGEETTHETKE